MKTVIFDLGETLVDETRQWQVVAEATGIPFFTLAGVIGARIQQRQDHWAAYEEFGIEAKSAVRHGYRVDISLFYPDALPALRALKDAGYRVGIVANQPEGIVEQLHELDLQLDLVGSSATYGVAKPDPAFFRRIATDCGLPPGEIVYVGDRLDNDILPAQSIGMHAVFIRHGPWGYIHAHWPEMAEVRYRIDGLDALPDLLRRIDAAG